MNAAVVAVLLGDGPRDRDAQARLPDYEIGHQAIEADLSRDWTPAEMLATLPADSVRIGGPTEPPSYNSINYVLLADLITQVSGQPWAAALRADLLDPAGLDRTWVQTAETPTPPLTVGSPLRRPGVPTCPPARSPRSPQVVAPWPVTRPTWPAGATSCTAAT